MIECRKLSKSYGSTTAVKEVSFTVPEGKIACLIGPSGCGKTTTLKMINRLIEPSSGDVFINQESILSQDPIQLRRKIGYVIQRVGLMPHMRISRNVGLLEEVKKSPKPKIKERVSELLELVGLPVKEYGRRYPGELSGGQQQRIGIARALMSNPPLLLMDEPFGALDPITRNSMQQEFLRLNEKLKKTIILVTHDLTEAFKMADQVILMNQGKIVQAGTKTDFVQRPANEFVKEFVESQIIKSQEKE